MEGLPLGTIVKGDALDVLRGWPDGCVQCCVTSPPYWGLRDYGLDPWVGGAADCDHKPKPRQGQGPRNTANAKGKAMPGTGDHDGAFKSVCAKCGAVRAGQQIGLEPTPEEHVARLVEVFREVRRVLRCDGTLWLNYGDAYAAGSKGGPWDEARTQSKSVAPGVNYTQQPNRQRLNGLKPKDLIGLPWMVAFALRADGWWLRSDIVWAKGVSFCPSWAGSVMPESVRDRPTRAHEYVFLLTKAPRYFYDAEAVREAWRDERNGDPGLATSKYNLVQNASGAARYQHNTSPGQSGRNLRSVWVINPQPYPGAHFATFPEALVEPCVRAGTSERGACPRCGAPWVREVEASGGTIGQDWRPDKTLVATKRGDSLNWADYQRRTTGWAPSCGCGLTPRLAGAAPLQEERGEGQAMEPVPCVVLDPFAGSGTTGMVAARLGRAFVGIDLAGGDKDLGGHTAHDRIRAAAEGRTTEEAAGARRHGQTELFGAGHGVPAPPGHAEG